MPTTPKRSSARCCPQGYSQVETPEDAGLVLYNTCSIRDKAEQKVFNRLQNFKREAGKGKVFGVLGCVAQQEGEKIFDRAPHVSLVARIGQLHAAAARCWCSSEAGNRRVTGLSLDTDETFDTPFTRRDNPHRAYITIIEGCDKSCAYCVVPFTRGPERSRTSESVMAEARRLAETGYTEIQLLGQNVNSYRDPSPAGWDFATLLARVGEDPGHPPRALHHHRIRAISCKAIVDAMDANPALCDHVHLPVQSGSSRVLAAMDRLYTRDEYMRRIEWMKNAQRRYSLTTDIIVGFPGETEADFQQTLDLLDEVQYDSLFSFKYSPRPNTAALAMEDQIPEEEKQRRLLIAAGEAARHPDPAQRGADRRACRRCWWKAATRRWASGSAAPRSNRTLNFTHPDDERKISGRHSTCRARDARRSQLAGG